MNESIRAKAGRGRVVVEAESEGARSKGKAAPKGQDAAGGELPTREDVDGMTAEELADAIPAAEEALEAIEAEFEELRARRDEALAVVNAMTARGAALEGSEEEGQA